MVNEAVGGFLSQMNKYALYYVGKMINNRWPSCSVHVVSQHLIFFFFLLSHFLLVDKTTGKFWPEGVREQWYKNLIKSSFDSCMHQTQEEKNCNV